MKFFWKMRRDKIEVMAAKKRKAVASCSPVAGSSFSFSSLTVAVTGAFSSFADELSVTTGAGFSVSLGRTYSGRVTTGGASVPTELCLLPTSITRSCAGVASVWRTLRLLPFTSTYSTKRPSFPSDRTCSFPLSNCGFSRRIVLNGTTLLTISKLGSVKTRSLTPSSGLEEVIGFSGCAGVSG